MATHDFRSLQTFPKIRTIQPSNTFDVIKLPSQVSRVQIGCSTAACYICDDKSDGDAVTSIDNFVEVPANNLETIHIGRGSSRNTVLQVALTSAGTGKVTIVLEEM